MARDKLFDERRGFDLLLGGGLIVSWAAFVGSVVIRGATGEYNPWCDAGLYNVPFALAALVCARRSGREPEATAAWKLLSAGLLVYAAANVYSSIVIGDRDIYPSMADAAWLLFYVLVYCALVKVARAGMTAFHASTWMDGGIVGLGTAAFVAAFVLERVLADTSGRVAVVATNLAYPVADLLLVVALVGWSVVHRAMNRSVAWVTLGLCTFGIGDVVFLYQSANDTYREGGILDVSWPLGALCLGLAALTRASIAEPRPIRRPPIMVPAVFTAATLGLLTYGQFHQLSVVAVVLSLCALLAAAARMALTMQEVSQLASSRHEARTDEVTGLGNRRAFIEAVDVELAGGRRIALVIADLDEFKAVNDDHGHDVGDQLLRSVGARLSAAVDATATVARLGGDEFGLVIRLEPEADLRGVGRTIADAVCGPIRIEGLDLEVRASFGLAEAAHAGTTRSELFRAADISMYRAKRSKSEVCVFDPWDPLATGGIRDLIDHHLALTFQPVFRVSDGHIESVEALARIRLRDGQVLTPAAFLDEVQRAGLEFHLTTRVLQDAMAFFHGLRSLRPDLSLRINVFANDLENSRLPDVVASAAAAHRIPLSAVVIEVTETALSGTSQTVAATVETLRRSGVRVAVDDFGAGHSSLGRLLELNVDELKLDALFARDIAVAGRTQSLVGAAVQLGRALQLSIVAEGVENAAALAAFAQAGCGSAQGYHLAEPLWPEALLDLLSTTSPGADARPDHWEEVLTVR